MSPAEHILQKLNELKTPAVSIAIGQSQLADHIYRLLMSKKFRKYAVTPSYQAHILKAIQENIARNEPIKLTLIFGGYKLWRLEESPEADWAELFSLVYYANWLKPIVAVYKPGVWFDFYSDDVILEIMNNISKKETEQYIQSFKGLLEFVKQYTPDNLRFTLNRVGEQYANYDKFKEDLAGSIEGVRKESQGKPLTEEQMTAIELNVRLNPGQADDPLWREKVNLIHDGYAKVSKRRPYYRTSDKIVVITRSIKDCVAVGTTKRSVVKFWIGAGVLEKDAEGYHEHVFSPKQLQAGKFTQEIVSIPGLRGKNFGRIRVFSSEQD